MNKRLAVLTAVAASLVCGSVLAAGQGSIGVVNVKSLFESSASVKAEKTKLQNEFKGKRDSLAAEQKSVQAMMAKYKKNESVMNADQKKKMQTEIIARQTKIGHQGELYAQQADAAQGKAMQSFLGKLKAAAAKVAAEKHLSLVLANADVIYSAKDVDITTDVASSLK